MADSDAGVLSTVVPAEDDNHIGIYKPSVSEVINDSESMQVCAISMNRVTKVEYFVLRFCTTSLLVLLPSVSQNVVVYSVLDQEESVWIFAQMICTVPAAFSFISITCCCPFICCQMLQRSP